MVGRSHTPKLLTTIQSDPPLPRLPLIHTHTHFGLDHGGGGGGWGIWQVEGGEKMVPSVMGRQVLRVHG